MENVLSWLTSYGYPSLFGLLLLGIVGLPVPDETLLVFSGYLISKGRLRPELTFAAALAGSACGISLSYGLGRSAGHSAVERYGAYVHLNQRHLEKVNRWFCRVGDWLLLFGYFIPGVRHCTALAAGISKLDFRRFALFAYVGAALWVATFLTIGFYVGEKWRAVLRSWHRYTLWLAVPALAIGAAILCSQALRRKGKI